MYFLFIKVKYRKSYMSSPNEEVVHITTETPVSFWEDIHRSNYHRQFLIQ